MIYDNIKNYELYSNLRPDFKEALELLNSNNFEKALGRYEFKNGMYYLVQSYESKLESDTFFESHRKYIDIQYVTSGKERHNVANISTLTIRDSYNEEKDLIKYDGQGSSLIVEAGYFAIYFPEDGHMPNARAGNEPETISKVIFKIPV